MVLIVGTDMACWETMAYYIIVPKVLHNSTLSNINNREKFTVVSVFQHRVSFNNYMDKKGR
jgi:hypothetical protein